MATSQKLQEHFLTCTICTEVFDNPCTLVCYHTFCRKCVVNYTKTKPEAIRAKSLLCPFCSKMTKVTAPERPMDEWADDVKPSFVIQGLLDSFGPGCKDAKDCTCCQGEGETTPATVWCSACDDALCEACARAHRRFPATRHHDVLDLSGDVNIPRKRKVMCNEHKDECIKFLCKDCKKVTCHTCCVIYHRKCESVVTLESELPALKSQLLNTKETISKKQMELKTKVDGLTVNIISAKHRHGKAEQDIMSFGNKARRKISQVENKLLDKLKNVSEKQIEQLTADLKTVEMSVQMYRQQSELIDQTLQSDCDMDVYEMYQGCEAGDVDAVGGVDVKKKGRIAWIMFKQNTDRLSRMLDDLTLGDIIVCYDGLQNLNTTSVAQNTGNVLDLKAAPVIQDTGYMLDLKAAPVIQDTGYMLDLKAAPVIQDTGYMLDLKAVPVIQDTGYMLDLKVVPVLQDTINVRVAGDMNEVYVSDVTVLLVSGSDIVIVTDTYNNSVKSFFTRNNQQSHSNLKLGGAPWGITRLKHNQVVVTVPDISQIVTVRSNPGLILMSIITTRKQYRVITSLTPSTLAAGSDGCVDILDMTGNVLKSISPVDNGDEIIHGPDFLCTTRTGNILVSDDSSGRVLCLTAEGDVVFTYPAQSHTTLKSPCGITNTSTGDILVTDYSEHTVAHLTESGHFVRNILTSVDGVLYPNGVCVDGRGRVYVCNYISGEIHVFTCSKIDNV